MKKLTPILTGLAVLLIFSTCSSNPRITRIDSGTIVDLSGYWNDSDVRIVCSSLIKDCLSSPRVDQFIRQYAAENDGRLPAALMGTFRNDSSEHIDTSIITITMESAIVESGKFIFVSGGDTREETREDRQDQLMYASDATAASLGNETGARLLFTGSVKSMVDRAGRDSVRSYFVDAQLTNIETNERLWMGTNSEIKKVIRQAAVRP